MSQSNDAFSKLVQHTVWDFIISRGIACLIIGILFIAIPEASMNIICIILGVFLLLNGLVALIKLMKSEKGKKFLLVYGLFCLAAGIVILINPEFLANLIIKVFALLIFITGVNQIIAGVKAKESPTSARLLASFTGVISIALGVVLFMHSGPATTIIITFIGIYFMAFGILAIATGTVIRKANKDGQAIVE